MLLKARTFGQEYGHKRRVEWCVTDTRDTVHLETSHVWEETCSRYQSFYTGSAASCVTSLHRPSPAVLQVTCSSRKDPCLIAPPLYHLVRVDRAIDRARLWSDEATIYAANRPNRPYYMVCENAFGVLSGIDFLEGSERCMLS